MNPKPIIRSLAALGLMAMTAVVPVKANDAKGLFFTQLQLPKEQINTGLKYWLELRRGGKVSRVDNLRAFRSGDQLRLHLIPNVDGYAYVVLLKGSTGKQTVLYPAPGSGATNRVLRGKHYILPAGGVMTLDKNPGQETLRLAVARTPVNATALLNDSSKVLIASGQLESSAPEGYMWSAAPKAEETNVDESMNSESFSKDIFVESFPRKSAAPRKSQTLSPVKSGTANIARRPIARRSAKPAVAAPDNSVVVVSTNPSKTLLVDINIDHN